MSTAQVEPPLSKEPSHPSYKTPPVVPMELPQEAPPRRLLVYAILLLVAFGFGALVVFLVIRAKASATGEGERHRAMHDLPVVIAKVRRGDLNQYLIGLGTVTPLSTVTLKSRVDGEITQIAFTEGQMVKQGDFLLQIDPRPYEAALKQAQGQLAKDQAAEKGADWNVQQDAIALKDKGISQQQLITDTATRDQDAGAIMVDQANIDAAQLNIDYSRITSPISGRIGLRLVDLGNIVHATDTTGLVVITQLQPIAVVFTLPEDDLAQVLGHDIDVQDLVADAYDSHFIQKIATGKVLAIDSQIDPTTGTVKIKAQFDNKDNELFPNQFVNVRVRVNTIHNALLVPAAGIQHSPTVANFAYVLTPAPPAATGPSASPDPAAPTDPAGGASSGATPATRPSGKESHGGGIVGTVSMRQVTVGPTQAAIASEGVDTTVVLSGLEPGDIIVTDGVDKLTEGSKVIGHMPPPSSGGATTRESAGATTQPARRRRHTQNAE